MQFGIIQPPSRVKNDYIPFSRRNKAAHAPNSLWTDETNSFKSNKRALSTFYRVCKNVGSARYHFPRLPGGMCHRSFNPWLPATLPSKRRETKGTGEKGKHNSCFIKSGGNREAINAEHDTAIFLFTDSEIKGWGSCEWQLNTHVHTHELRHACKSALASILCQSWLFFTLFSV